MKNHRKTIDPSPLSTTEQMPLLFLGHGNPMNAIEENEFVQGFRECVKTIPQPNAIVCISAHWETNGTCVTAMGKPQTIHDFSGFPQSLFNVQYPAPGSPELANEIRNRLTKTSVGLHDFWGLDHGTWSVVKHLYPNADVPVVQLSLDNKISLQKHYEIAKELAFLRKKGVLIVGSGNMVHNLKLVDWNKPKEAYEWASQSNETFKRFIANKNHSQLIDYKNLGKDVQLAVPTPEHYLPMLYIVALQQDDEQITFFNDKIIMGSLSMTSFRIG